MSGHREESATPLNPRQLRIMEAGWALFKRHGIKRVTVEEICRSAEVSKVTFYKYFPNKNRLALEILQHQIDQAEDAYQAIHRRDIPYEEKAREIIKLKLEYSRGMSSEMMADFFASPVSEVAEFIKNKTEENLQLYMRDFREAQKMGEIRPDIKPQFIMYFLNHMREMLDDERLLGLYESPEELTRELMNFFFYGILPRRGGGEGGP